MCQLKAKEEAQWTWDINMEKVNFLEELGVSLVKKDQLSEKVKKANQKDKALEKTKTEQLHILKMINHN